MNFQNIVHHKVLVNLARADGQICFWNSNSFVALKSAGRSLGCRKNCLERCQSSEDGTSTFIALVHWMDETLVCEELLPLSSRLSPPLGFLFHE